jgi:hypothetical protein
LLPAIIVQFYPEHAKHALALVCPCGWTWVIFARDNNKTSEQVGAGAKPESRQLPLLVFLFGAGSGLCFFMLLTGCARFHSVQVQTRADGTKTESRQTISTFWDSQSSIAKLRASTTDKTQGLTVGGFAEESQSSNVVNVIEAVAKGAVQGAAAALGKP